MVNTPVVMVTGGARGIGRAIVQYFAGRGLRVVIADTEARAGLELARSLGPEALFLKTDVSRETQVKRMVAAAVRAFGRLDALINNAAIADPVLPDLNVKTWHRVIGVNLTGAFLCAR